MGLFDIISLSHKGLVLGNYEAVMEVFKTPNSGIPVDGNLIWGFWIMLPED